MYFSHFIKTPDLEAFGTPELSCCPLNGIDTFSKEVCMRTLELAGVQVPVIGQGTWRMGEDRSAHKREVAALRTGIELGMTLIDSAEMYAEGGAESVVGEAIAGLRDQVFLVSKVYPHNASRKGIPQACERSLRRLDTDYIDLYLLHWRGQYPLEETVEAFERLREDGKIGRWGVSNFDVDDLEELSSSACATNQVLYNLEERGIEFDLLPWCQHQRMPLMAYCPIGQGGAMLAEPVLNQIAIRHGVTPAQVSLAWILRQDGVIAIPKAVRPEHVQLNAQAAHLQLEAGDLAALDQAFQAPQRKQRLAMV
jgi:diketogulonate reductase-like aldo/keto reductase